jgi:hypothetical protein
MSVSKSSRSASQRVSRHGSRRHLARAVVGASVALLASAFTESVLVILLVGFGAVCVTLWALLRAANAPDDDRARLGRE